jgi:hypothetical protein
VNDFVAYAVSNNDPEDDRGGSKHIGPIIIIVIYV